MTSKSCIVCGTNNASGWVSGPTCKKCYMKEYNQRKDRKQAQRERGQRLDVIQKHNEWVEANKDKVRAYKRKYRKNNPDKVKETKRNYHKSDSYKKVKEKYTSNNKHILTANAAKRRAYKQNATPPWLSKEQKRSIKLIYKKAKELEKMTGIPHHVDHIHPLNHKNLCGLHVPWNLQVLTASENLKKSNTLEME